MSWSMGMTFDALRNRELWPAWASEGFLYAYAPDSGAWSVVSSHAEPRPADSHCLSCRARSLYGSKFTGPITAFRDSFRFDAQGTYQGEIKAARLFRGMWGLQATRLNWCRLAIISRSSWP